jgi:hypothetical protein
MYAMQISIEDENRVFDLSPDMQGSTVNLRGVFYYEPPKRASMARSRGLVDSFHRFDLRSDEWLPPENRFGNTGTLHQWQQAIPFNHAVDIQSPNPPLGPDLTGQNQWIAALIKSRTHKPRGDDFPR